METLLSLIKNYQLHISGADTQILERMTPLLRGHAAKIHCMEYEDALQELSLTLLESLRHLDTSKSEGECISYIQSIISNRRQNLCRQILAKPSLEELDVSSCTLVAPDPYDDTYIDFRDYIEKLPKNEYRYQIISRFFYEDKSDTEIAAELNLTYQYVNRLKREIIRKYFSIR